MGHCLCGLTQVISSCTMHSFSIETLYMHLVSVLSVFDATGFEESGRVSGNLVFEGRYLQCVKPPPAAGSRPFETKHCLGLWIGNVSANNTYIRQSGV